MSELAIDNLPEGWVLTQLKDVCRKITDGTHKTPKYQDKGVRFISIKNIKPFQPVNWEAYEKYISQEEHEELINRCKPEYDDILFPRIGTLGYAKRIDFKEEVSIFVGLGLLKPIKEIVQPRYLEYWMNHPLIYRLSHERATGSGRLTLALAESKKLPIPLAPYEQQKRIVAKIEELFSHIDAGIEALKKAKQLLKQYRQSVLKAAVTGELTREWREANKDKLEPASQLLERILKERRQKWEEQQLEQFKAKGKMPKDDKWKEKYVAPGSYDKKANFELPAEWTWVYLGQLGEVIGGLTKNKKRDQFEIRLPYLRVANVYANELRLDDVTKIGVQECELERVLLEKGDLLVVEGNGSPEQIGRLAIWDGSIEPCVHQNHLIKVRLQERDSGNYLMYWLSSLGGRDAILQGASSTSGLYTLSISKVSGLPIPLPPIEEQVEVHNNVSSKLSSIEHLENEIDVQLIKAEKSKQAILASAFSGQLMQGGATE